MWEPFAIHTSNEKQLLDSPTVVFECVAVRKLRLRSFKYPLMFAEEQAASESLSGIGNSGNHTPLPPPRARTPRVLGFLSAREQGHHGGTYDSINNGKGSGVSHASLCVGQVGRRERRASTLPPSWRTRNTVEGTRGAFKFALLALQMIPVFNFQKIQTRTK